MPSVGEIRAGQAYVEAGWKDDALKAGMKASEAKLKALGAGITAIGSKIAGLGAIITTPFLGAAAMFAESGAALLDMSDKTGISVESLSIFRSVATQTGQDMDALVSGITKMEVALVKAAQGGEEARQALANIGLTIGDLKSLSPEQQFQAIANGINKVANADMKVAAARGLFGRAGADLLPTLGRINDLMAERAGQPPPFTKEDAQNARALSEAWRMMTAMGGKLSNVIGGALAPTLTTAIKLITDASKSGIAWVKENVATARTLFWVAGAATVGGLAIVGLGTAFTLLGSAVGGVVTVLSAVGAIVGVLTSPFTLIAAGAIAAGAAFLTMSESGKKAIGFLGSHFASFLGVFKTTWGGITDALTAGDLALAGKIAMAGLKAAWLTGLEALKASWGDMWNALPAQFTSGWSVFMAKFTDGWGKFMSGWEVFTAKFTDGLQKIEPIFKSVWDGMTKSMEVVMKIWKGLWGEFEYAMRATVAAMKGELIEFLTMGDTKAAANASGGGLLKAAGSGVSAADAADAKDAKEESDAWAAAFSPAAMAQRKLDALQREAKKKLGDSQWEEAWWQSKRAPDIEALATKTEGTHGSFNSRALELFGGNTVNDQILQATKDVADNTAKSVNVLKDIGEVLASSGMVFI